MDNIVNDPHMPFVGPLPESLQPGFTIKIRGKVNRRGATGFSVNLQCGAKPKSDVAMHLNMVFSSPSQVVLNSMLNEEWGPEEIHGSGFPFSYGQTFEIIILTDPEEFKIAFNGQHSTEFAHRLPLELVSHISIDGDVTLNSIRYETNSYGPTPSERNQVEITRPVGFQEIKKSTGGGSGQDYPTKGGYGAPFSSYPGSDPSPMKKGSLSSPNPPKDQEV